MAEQDWTFNHTLRLLAQKGLRYATVFDLGCADGHFFVENYLTGCFPASVPVNIDANRLYEPSLQSIQAVFGGHYRIAAASDVAGEIELTTSLHPYWNSVRPPGDLYWDRLNGMTAGLELVPALRLDDLAEELDLKPPFLLKLDIQGAEVQALRGARSVLAATDVVICEADIADFQAINAELVAAGFDLFDLTLIERVPDGTLGWFYPVYLSRRLAHLRPKQFFRAADNEAVIRSQIERRREITAKLGAALAQIRRSRQTKD